MRNTLIGAGFIALAICLIAPPMVVADMPGPDPEAVWNYITKVSPYTKWGFWPDHQGMQPGRAPHGPLHKVYVNDRGLNSSRLPVQYGALFVKENYSAEKKLEVITIMYKVYGYNPKDGDWFWAKYSLDGKADKYGKPQGCIGCHGTRVSNDFVLVHEFR